MLDYTGNPPARGLYEHLISEYNALLSIEYSGEKGLQGWNVKFHKAGRALCRFYPRQGFFIVLIVVGQREKDSVETLLPAMSEYMQALYQRTQEGMGQKWLLIEVDSDEAVYRDIQLLVRLRRESGKQRAAKR